MGWAKFSVVLIIVCAVKCLAMTYHKLKDSVKHHKTSHLSPILKKAVDPNNDFHEEEAVYDHAWEDSGMFEGDMILNGLIGRNAAVFLSNGVKNITKRWPANEIIYYIHKEHFTNERVQAINKGIEALVRASCVKFRPYKKGDRDVVFIQGSCPGCFSDVGYQSGCQVLNLSDRCFIHGTIVHELLHTLGFYHMHSSLIRDDYVEIIWPNIKEAKTHNFRKLELNEASDFGVGYDYESIMHYSRRAFSINGSDTIVPKQSGAQIGQNKGLSDKDTIKLNKMYCDADSDSGQVVGKNTSKKTKNKKKYRNSFDVRVHKMCEYVTVCKENTENRTELYLN